MADHDDNRGEGRRPGNNTVALWKVFGEAAGTAAFGAVLSLLFNGASDITTMVTWAAIGAGIGLLHGIYEASQAIERAARDDRRGQAAPAGEVRVNEANEQVEDKTALGNEGPRNGPV